MGRLSMTAKIGSASVALFSGSALAGISVGLTSVAPNSVATASPQYEHYDDYERNTETCRREYPHWDHLDFVDVWFGRDNNNNPVCMAQPEWQSYPIALCWPAGAVVSVIANESDCDCQSDP